MRAIRLEVMEWCQLSHKVVEFGAGLTGVIGPNGSGKSNLLSAMRFALTGVNQNVGKTADNVRQQSDTSAVSGVDFTFEHNGQTAIVKRWLRPDRQSTLELHGQVIRGDKKINEAIVNLLGVDFHVVNDITIVGQSDVFGFIDQKKAKRAEAFAKLFRTEEAAKCWEACGTHLSQLPPLQHVEDVTALARDLAIVQHNLHASQQRLGGATSTQLNQQWMAASERHRAAVQYAETSGNRSQLQAQATEIERLLAGYAAVVKEKSDSVATLQKTISDMTAEATEASNALAAWDHLRQIEASKKRITEDISRLEAVEDPAPAPATLPKPLREVEQQILELQTSLARRSTFVESLKDGIAECPTCGTPAATLASHLADAKASMPGDHIMLTAMRESVTRFRDYETAKVIWTKRQELKEGNLIRLREQLAAFSNSPPAPAASKEQLQSVLAEHREYQAAMQVFSQELSAAQQAHSLQLGRQQAVTAQLANCDRMLAGQAAETSSLADLLAASVSLQQQFALATQLENDIRGLTAQANDLDRRHSLAAVATVARDRAQQWITKVKTVRDVLHRDGAQRFVFQTNLQRLQAAANQYLELFDTDFRVSASEGLTFEAQFTDGRRQVAERLSGGQQVILAIATRLALNFMYGDLNFLALDEPTAYLDAHHIQGFRPVLERLREFASSRGFQCIMITHEQSLAPLLDSVVQL